MELQSECARLRERHVADGCAVAILLDIGP